MSATVDIYSKARSLKKGAVLTMELLVLLSKKESLSDRSNLLTKARKQKRKKERKRAEFELVNTDNLALDQQIINTVAGAFIPLRGTEKGEALKSLAASSTNNLRCPGPGGFIRGRGGPISVRVVTHGERIGGTHIGGWGGISILGMEQEIACGHSIEH